MSGRRNPSEPGPEDQHAGTVATENPAGGRPGERHEVGDSHTSRRDPPHPTESDREASRHGEKEDAGAPVLPANAGGRDRVSSEEQDFEVDEESAYDRRPSEDKDSPPSEG